VEIRKVVAPLLAALLLGAVGTGIWYSHEQLGAERPAIEQGSTRQTVLHGLIGSEKAAFFADARVQQVLAGHGLDVVVEKAGSRAIAARFDPQHYDFGFPSGAPAAAELRRLAGNPNVYTPFYTPLVIASWQPIAAILVANGIARADADGDYQLDLKALLALVGQGRRWRDLPHSEAFATGKSVLPMSTDVRSSNSAAMYLSLASYLANGEQVVQSGEQLAQVLPQVAPLFLRQGFQESSSADPFEDYLALGMGKAPLLVAYESQLVEFRLRHPQAGGDIAVLYPRPTIYSKHVLVPFTPAGARLGEALENDPELRKLAHEYGFRTGGDEHGPRGWREQGVKVPAQLVDVIEPPSHEWLERLIEGIEQQYR